jgi:hypothetical protein
MYKHDKVNITNLKDDTKVLNKMKNEITSRTLQGVFRDIASQILMMN